MRKRDFRRLWITRINAAARMNGISYSVLMNGLKQRNITINRKMLADIAVNDPAAFTKLVETVKAELRALFCPLEQPHGARGFFIPRKGGTRMPAVTTPGIVLRYANYRDHDRMLTLLSPRLGRVDLLSRGCRRPKSPLMPASELFVSGEFVLFEKMSVRF